jgi:hypothetical protein
MRPSSSENYLVIGGRDRQQNEILVRRYLKKGMAPPAHAATRYTPGGVLQANCNTHAARARPGLL